MIVKDGSLPQASGALWHQNMHVTLQHTYCWPQMAASIPPSGRNYVHCAKSLVCFWKQDDLPELFPAFQSLKSVTICIPDQYPKVSATSNTSSLLWTRSLYGRKWIYWVTSAWYVSFKLFGNTWAINLDRQRICLQTIDGSFNLVPFMVYISCSKFQQVQVYFSHSF